MFNYKKCVYCRKKKLFVKKRQIYLKSIAQMVISQQPICRKCQLAAKNIEQ